MRLSQCITRAAQVAPRRTATVFGERSRSWEEHADRVARLAGALRALGVRSGDRVAFRGSNSDRYLEWFFAVGWAGAVVVPVSVRLAPPEVRHVVDDSGARLLLADDELEDLIAGADPVAPALGSGSELAGLFYTGGTTGRAKAVMLSHDNLIANVLHLVPGTGWGQDSVYLHATPMSHLSGCIGMTAMALCAGTSVIVERFAVDGLLRAVAERGVTHTLLVPTMLAALVDELEREPRELGSLRGIHYAGSPVAEVLIERALHALPGVELSQGYGQTEASGAITMLVDGPAGKTRSAGQAVLGVEVAILDEGGSEVPRGEVGEICARGDNVMHGYWNQPELTAETLRGGWLHTGDLGSMDDDGFVSVVDRLKDMIIVGASNVYSAEVENAIAAHPAVAECAVVAAPGEQVHAVVVVRDGHRLATDELIAHCGELIAEYKCPQSVEIRTEPLPRSGAGKVLKTELRP
jgi:acyl-CoA synthetase (AMP-forming)/AMP-acid ligase II